MRLTLPPCQALCQARRLRLQNNRRTIIKIHLRLDNSYNATALGNIDEYFSTTFRVNVHYYFQQSELDKSREIILTLFFSPKLFFTSVSAIKRSSPTSDNFIINYSSFKNITTKMHTHKWLHMMKLN